MKLREYLLSGLIAVFALAGIAHAQDRLIISELVGDNNGSLLDEDGDSSDWIEIHNAGAGTVNLGGWHLTDDAANLTLWTFPSTNLPPGGFLVVFASAKNRAVAGAQLHTSFQLNASGEYLALVKPNGITIAHEFAPAFPPQVSGVSYGLDIVDSPVTFVTNSNPIKWLVPLNAGAMPADWATTNFNDAAWSSGFPGLGYSGGTATNFGTLPATNNVARSKPTMQSSTNTFGPQIAVNGNYTDYTHTLAGANLPATWEVNLTTNCGIERIVLWNRTSNKSRLRDITVRILSADGTATNYTSALLNPENVLGGGVLNQGPDQISINLTQQTGALMIGGRVRVTRTPDPDRSGSGGTGTTSEADVLALAEVEVFGAGMTVTTGGAFANLVQTDIRSAMTNVNSTALMRVPFLIPEEELPVLDRLTLRMKYDDGFIAYLNGVEIARRNSPATPAWNSAATTNHADSAALVFEDIDVSPFIPLLQEGNNVLAIQGLNVTTNDSDFLLLPVLEGHRITLVPDRYYATPSPGAANSGGALGQVADTKFSMDRGFHDVPFTVAITSATAGAEIRFTTNGSTPDAVSGTLYTDPITIDRTTVLRAIATKPGWLPSDVDTHTYVFLSNVITQNTASAMAAGFPSSWAGNTVDYAMDPNVTATYAEQMTNALRSLPSVFVTTTISNLFDSTYGIYSHPLKTGVTWERPIAIEMVDTNGSTEFQENCGLRIQGGVFFRDFSFTQKKSFRVLFKGIYGTGKLHHDLFKERGAAEEFDGFVLRAGANDGYAWGGAGTTVQFIRDEFGRRLNLAMGHPTGRGMFVHLYLNGLYWGMYNLAERPNEDFSASYLGGVAEEWDACAAGDFKNGGTAASTRWNTFLNQANAVTTFDGYQTMQGRNADGTPNPAVPCYFDRENYLDYMILNMWGGNWDWPNKNFWFGYNTNDNTGYKFYVWDFENVMGNSRDRSPLNMISPRSDVAAQWVGLPHYHLKDYPEYQLDFADRVQRHFFNGGLLTPEVLTNRYHALADSVQAAIIAESARWGDDNHTPAYGLPEWLGERDWILTNYLPQRTSIVLTQFISGGLFPSVLAPAFNQFGGTVPAGFTLSMTNPNSAGTIFYTLNGTDPRVPGSGAVSGSAQSYAGGIAINAPTEIRARVLNGSWSPVVVAVFYPPQDLSKLALTEIMYHAPNVGATNGDEFDFIELKNTGTNTLNLSGLTFTSGVTFTFTNGTTIAPGEFAVFARNAAAMAAKYPAVPLRGLFTGKLDNGGEAITLSLPTGQKVFSVSYNDKAPWPVAADGFGFSLVQRNAGLSQAPDGGGKWRTSSQLGGSPGADDPEPGIAPIVINEVLTHTDPPQSDSIELFNPTGTNVSIGGWYLSDDPSTPKKFRIPANTIIAPSGYVWFTETDFNPTPGTNNSFVLNSVGDDVYLFSADESGQLTGYSHGFEFGAVFNGVSIGRYVNSAGEESFPLLTSLSFGAANGDPRVGPIVISEIQFHPAMNGDEFVELMNIGGSEVPLFDPAHPTNTWKVPALGFTFPTNITLGAQQILLLVATNPASFRAKYGISNTVQILGPYSGALDNNGENLELQAPDSPDPGLVPYVTVEAIRYNDKSPWPAGASGTGSSLQRVVTYAYGDEPANWIAAAPTPGTVIANSDTDGDGLPDAWEAVNGTQVNVPDAGNDPDGDGFTNWQEYLAGTNPVDAGSLLKISGVTATASGAVLEFLAASNHTYSVLQSTNLNAAMWSKLTDIPAQPASRWMRVTNSANGSATRFYRLTTPAQL